MNITYKRRYLTVGIPRIASILSFIRASLNKYNKYLYTGLAVKTTKKSTKYTKANLAPIFMKWYFYEPYRASISSAWSRAPQKHPFRNLLSIIAYVVATLPRCGPRMWTLCPRKRTPGSGTTTVLSTVRQRN